MLGSFLMNFYDESLSLKVPGRLIQKQPQLVELCHRNRHITTTLLILLRIIFTHQSYRRLCEVA